MKQEISFLHKFKESTLLVNFLLSILSFLFSIFLVIYTYFAKEITTPIILIFSIPDFNSHIMSISICAIIILIITINLIASYLMLYGYNTKTNNLIYKGVLLTKRVYGMLHILLIAAIISVFIGFAGPFFLMPFSLLPMLIFALIFSLMSFPLKRVQIMLNNLMNIYRDVQIIEYSKFRKTISQSLVLLFLVGIIEIFVFLIIKLFISFDTLDAVFDLTILPFQIVFSIYLCIVLPMMALFINSYSGDITSDEIDNRK